MKRLEGKVALIYGTARGQGRAAALRFAAEGALVVGGDLLHEEAVETQLLIARERGSALAPGPLDVADEDSVRAWVAEAADAFGGIDTSMQTPEPSGSGRSTAGPARTSPLRCALSWTPCG
ncbi:SDR family NAD(P)-dependent oxidoreductase [Streptomyces atroolivaceus]|uniref:SDR family NAD(P)-dependent oxidoreductase n=1 Tax=Streptomyces atroolivaceus TaxID=66869 RepID=UPI00366208FE